MKRDASVFAVVSAIMGFAVLCYGLATKDNAVVISSLVAFAITLLMALIAALAKE